MRGVAFMLCLALCVFGVDGIGSAQPRSAAPEAASGSAQPDAGVRGPVLAQAGPVAAGQPVPIWGVVLGTVVVGGLLYLISHGPDGNYYRYPYYGSYYQYYYNAGYRPYTGFYPAAAPLITVGVPIGGSVLGTVTVAGLLYLLVQGSDGGYYRYPYYGPYRQYYYRPEYRAYRGSNPGAYANASLRMGDPHWNGPVPQHQAPPYQSGPGGPYHQQPQNSHYGGGGPQSGGHPGGRPQGPGCGGRGEPPCPANNESQNQSNNSK